MIEEFRDDVPELQPLRSKLPATGQLTDADLELVAGGDSWGCNGWQLVGDRWSCDY